MRLLLMNPNSSERMTSEIIMSANRPRSTDADIDVVRMTGSPEVLESFADYVRAADEMLDFVESGGAAGYDGVLVCCFGDPGLYAIKESLDIPVLGIAECALSRALLLGGRFSVLAASAKARPMMENLVDQYGLQSRNAGTLTLDAPIEDFLGNPDKLAELVSLTLAGAGTDADVLIYGCAGMTTLAAENVERISGVTVIDPVVCGVTELLGVVSDRAHVSRGGLYARMDPV